MLNEMTVVQLKEMLKSRGLKVSGRKAELIERIQEFDEAIENYNTTKDVLVGYGAMYDYINRNITNEIDGVTGGNFLRSRIDDLILNDNNIDFIEYLKDDVENLLDFYINGGNDHTKSEIAEVRQFLNFLKNLSEHTLKRGAIDVWNDVVPSEPSEASEVNETPAQDDSDVTESDVSPAQEQDVPADEPTLVNKPITTFEGRTTLGKFIKSGIASKQYTVIHSDGYDFLMFNDQLCASEGFDSVTVVAKSGEIVKVYRLSSRGVSETCYEGDELRRL